MTVVLDASALLAVINDEPGAEMVEPLLDESIVSAVNLSEVAGKLVDRGAPEAEVRSVLEELQLDVRPFDDDQAFRAAGLRLTVPSSFALGDRACLALAMSLRVPAVTADHEWSHLSVRGLKVTLVR